MITCEYSRHLKVIKDDPRKSSVRLFLYFGAAKARVTLSLTLPPPPPTERNATVHSLRIKSRTSTEGNVIVNITPLQRVSLISPPPPHRG